MRFGIFYEHQKARPWDADTDFQLIQDALDQVELADKIGIDYVWEVEHHFLEEYSHSAAPEIFLAAASQRTKNIRLGHGIVNVLPGINHPARVAERIATLDLVSGGRVEFGTGESSSQAELGGFLIDREDKRAMWEEAVPEIARMMVENPYAGHKGRFFSMPQRNVVPKPLQKPHPPMWVACSRRDTISFAAKNGIGALSFSFIEPEQAKDWVDEYYGIIESDACVPAGFAVNPNLAIVLPMMMHEDEQTAIDRGIDGAHFFGYSLAHFYVFGDHTPGVTNIWEEFQERRSEFGFDRGMIKAEGKETLGVKLLQEGLGSLRGAIGTPEQVIDLVERYQKAGVDQVIFVSQCGHNQHEHIMESLELFGKTVAPHFAGSAEKREKEKMERLQPAIERAMARRAPARRAAPNYVITPMGEPGLEELGMKIRSTMISSDGVAGIKQKVLAGGEKVLGVVVEKASDGQLNKVVGSDRGMKVFFTSMAKMYRPEKAGKFRGDIQFTLTGGEGPKTWTVTVGDETATAIAGPSSDPKLLVRASAADFTRAALGQAEMGKDLIAGKLEVEGDVTAAAQLSEMFGGRAMY